MPCLWGVGRPAPVPPAYHDPPTLSQTHPGARIAPLSTASGAGDKLGSYDNLYEKDKIQKKPGDPNKRDFTYFVLGGARFIYASAARLVALKVRPCVDLS